MAMMLQGFQKAEKPRLFEEMFRLRKEVLFDQKGWDVKIVDGQFEIDEFDRDDTVYLLSLDERGNLMAACRLLNTVYPHMMSGPFKPMFPDVGFQSPVIWEATRWTARHGGKMQPNGVSYASCDICLTAVHFGLQYGVEQFVAIFEAPMRRMYRKCGMSPKVLSTISEGAYRGISAGIWDVRPENEEQILRATGLESSLISAAA